MLKHLSVGKRNENKDIILFYYRLKGVTEKNTCQLYSIIDLYIKYDIDKHMIKMK